MPLISSVMRAARGLWPTKTAAELQARTGISERMAKYLIAERCKLSSDQLAALLRSDEGLEILEAIIGDAQPGWWKQFKRQTRRSVLRRKIRELQQKIDEEDED